MYGDLGRWQLEDQPATASIDPVKSKHVADEDPVGLCVGTVDDDVCSVNHVSPSLSSSADSFVNFFPLLKKRPLIIRRHVVETVDAQRRWDDAYQCLNHEAQCIGTAFAASSRLLEHSPMKVGGKHS
jgi:hypothetical protein